MSTRGVLEFCFASGFLLFIFVFSRCHTFLRSACSLLSKKTTIIREMIIRAKLSPDLIGPKTTSIIILPQIFHMNYKTLEDLIVLLRSIQKQIHAFVTHKHKHKHTHGYVFISHTLVTTPHLFKMYKEICLIL